MMTYDRAYTLFQSARNKVKGKPLGRNTRLIQWGNSYGIKYHDTVILIISQAGGYTYNNGGWFTVTTKQRMNLYGPAKIHQSKHIWYINGIPYTNGITLMGEID